MSKSNSPEGPLPSFFNAAVDWSVKARVQPSEPGFCIVGVYMTNAEGLNIGIGMPFAWPENYEDRDMEAAGLAAAAKIFQQLTDELSATARERLGA